MDDKLKILVAAPIYDKMEYCFEEFLMHLRGIEGSEFDILLVDNSRSEEFFENLSGIGGVKVFRDETSEEKNIHRLISSRNKILEYAFEKNYDYLLMMDSDVMAPKNILSDLVLSNKDVISGLYFNLFNSGGQQKLLPVCWREIEDNTFEEMRVKGMLPDFITSKSDLRRNLTSAEIEEGKILEVLIPSAGCLLLSRKALSSGVKYGLLEDTHGLQTGDDIYFFKQLREKGFELYCDPSVYCKHLALNKYKENKDSHPIFD
ncbi:hypothetical protein CMI41_00870 [Candidatus Pacearchaeota archaeon]|nr:hypothetical protein [Candidatus Pacearchaeota archaeon]|tara:strand:+ start:1151 stop:1933 length:783 start_codon:yes stop_codon:yes gene_type:complete